ncbi:MAG: DUF2628 domain-containing protein [Ruminococcaceae bacterium]|nr:DUF2628 domain-containing protein [Oscillospiraceae bacterium]
MSKQIDGINCVRCKSYLFEEDDVIYCPICGAPHHRECYNALGHCALEEFHGTENEYSKPEPTQEVAEEEKAQTNSQDSDTTVCKMCSENYDSALKACPKCGTPNLKNYEHFNSFDLLGGVPEDHKFDDNVTANDVKKFVAVNTQRYLPRFVMLQNGKKTSWNWLAFLFPAQWMFSRKMFKNGVITAVLLISVVLFSFPLQVALNNLGVLGLESTTEMVKRLYEVMPQINPFLLAACFFSAISELAIRIFCGLKGDSLYRNHVIQKVKKIKAESEDIEFDYRRKGSVDMFIFLLSYFALQYLPVIIFSLL